MENLIETDFILKELLNTSYADLSDSSSSTSLSSDDEELFINLKNKSKRQKLEGDSDIFGYNYSDEEFKMYFKMERSTANKMIDRLQNSEFLPCHNDGREKISPTRAFLMILWYLSNQESFREVANRFNVTFSSAHRCLRRVLDFLLSLKDATIRWPTDGEAISISESFQQKNGIDNVIGCIDGSHIEILKPIDNHQLYLNDKGYYSLLLQVITDHEMRFLDVYCGEPGSLDDVELLEKSDIYGLIENRPDFIGDKIIIGDLAYPNLDWLVTPYKDYDGLTPNRKEFNYKLLTAGVVVENALGLLKARFRRLRRLDNKNEGLCIKIIKGACILHNICINENDLFEAEATDFNQPDHVDHCDDQEDSKRRNRRELLYNAMYENNT